MLYQPVYEAVEDDEGCEGENSDDNRGSSWHLQRYQCQHCNGQWLQRIMIIQLVKKRL